jgi:phage terminase small subunit
MCDNEITFYTMATKKPAKKTFNAPIAKGPSRIPDVDRPLTHRQQLFVKHYLACGNATRASQLAGYKYASVATHTTCASALLRLPHVAKFIKDSRSQELETLDLGPARVLKELMLLAFSNAQDMYDPETGEMIPIHQLPRDVAAAIAGIERRDGFLGGLKVKSYDKKAALELLGKYLKIFTDQNTIALPDGVPFERVYIVAGKAPENIEEAVVVSDKGNGSGAPRTPGRPPTGTPGKIPVMSYRPARMITHDKQGNVEQYP